MSKFGYFVIYAESHSLSDCHGRRHGIAASSYLLHKNCALNFNISLWSEFLSTLVAYLCLIKTTVNHVKGYHERIYLGRVSCDVTNREKEEFTA